jgi:FAD:protein FMN transferase
LLEGGVGDFLLHGGNSSVLARGARRVADDAAGSEETEIVPPRSIPQARGWEVGIRDPLLPSRRLAEIRLCDRALGTSGAQFQSFRHQGKRYGHILDPRTGWPAEGLHSATAVAPTAAMADAISTALYVMGPDAALAYCQARPGIAAVLACPAPGGSGLEIRSTGLEDTPGELQSRDLRH